MTLWSWFCPNSLCFETHFDSLGLVLSRFLLFRDTFQLFGDGSVPILFVSRHISTLWGWFCPDSLCFETHFNSLELVLSRFPLFRDTFLLFGDGSVPILFVSRHISTLWSSFCPDSLCFETHFNSLELFLSRFLLFPDTFQLFGAGSVPIPSVSGHISTLWDWFCPDSLCFETHSLSLELFLSQFSLFRDTFFLFRASSVPIPPVSRQNFTLQSLILSRFQDKSPHIQKSPLQKVKSSQPYPSIVSFIEII